MCVGLPLPPWDMLTAACILPPAAWILPSSLSPGPPGSLLPSFLRCWLGRPTFPRPAVLHPGEALQHLKLGQAVVPGHPFHVTGVMGPREGEAHFPTPLGLCIFILHGVLQILELALHASNLGQQSNSREVAG